MREGWIQRRLGRCSGAHGWRVGAGAVGVAAGSGDTCMLAHVASSCWGQPRHPLSTQPSHFLTSCCPSLHPLPPPLREERYVEIRDEMRHMLARVGWKPDFIEKSVPILPISGWMGDNLIKKSDKMGWWKGMDVKTVDNRTMHVDTLLDVSFAMF